MDDYDVCIIGAGPAGVRLARNLALTKKVLIIEKSEWGGTCVHRGCIPKKVAHFAAEVGFLSKDMRGFGWKLSAEFSWERFHRALENYLKHLGEKSLGVLKYYGVKTLAGTAVVEELGVVRVGSQRIKASSIVVAVGGKPSVPSFEGSEYVHVSDDFFQWKSLPQSALVIGGGFIALEFATILQNLGVQTALMYRGSRLMRTFDEDTCEFLSHAFTTHGLSLYGEDSVKEVKKLDNGLYRVTSVSGKVLEVERIVAAVGRIPLTKELGLKELNVAMESSGTIKVNENFETSVPGIFAIGDVIGGYGLTPVALKQADRLAKFLCGGMSTPIDYSLLPSALFSLPPAASVGPLEDVLKERGIAFRKYKKEFRSLRSAPSGGAQDADTFMKVLVAEEDNRILSLQVVGHDAPEIVQVFAFALEKGIKFSEILECFPLHPTVAEELLYLKLVN